MALSSLSNIATGPLVGVVIGQFLICLCRVAIGDFAAAVQDLVTVILGSIIFFNRGALPVLAYGASCICGLTYDVATSMSHLRVLQGAGKEVHGIGWANFHLLIVLMAPLLSLVGVLIAVRLYREISHGEPVEYNTLISGGRKAKEEILPGHYSSVGAGCKDGVLPLWPQQPQKPPPLSVCLGKEQKDPIPFQAIFGAPVESPWLPRSHKAAAAAAADAERAIYNTARASGPHETRRPRSPVSSPAPSLEDPGSIL